MKNKSKRIIFTPFLIIVLIGLILFNPYKSKNLENLIISLLSGLILILFLMLEEINYNPLRKFITKLFKSKSH